MEACGAIISALKKKNQRKKEKFGQHRGVQRDHLCPEREGGGRGGAGVRGARGGGEEGGNHASMQAELLYWVGKGGV